MRLYDLPYLGVERDNGQFEPGIDTVDGWNRAPQYIVRIAYAAIDDMHSSGVEHMTRQYRNYRAACTAARRLSRRADLSYARVYSRSAHLTLSICGMYRSGRKVQ